MTETPVRRHSLNFKEKLELAEFLKSVVETNDEGISFYKPGWTDAAVAKRNRCTPGNVQGVRVQLYPKFMDKVPAANASEIFAQRLADLEARVEYLERELGIGGGK